MWISIFAFLLCTIFWSLSDYIVVSKLSACCVIQVIFMRHIVMFFCSFLPFFQFNKEVTNHNTNGYVFLGMKFSKFIILRSVLSFVALMFLMYGFKLNLSVSELTAVSYSIPLFTMIFNIKNEKPSLSTMIFFSLMCIPLFCLKLSKYQICVPLIGCAAFGICDILIKFSKNTNTEEIRTSAFIISILSIVSLPIFSIFKLSFGTPWIFSKTTCIAGVLIGVFNYIFSKLLFYSFQNISFNKLLPFRFAQLILNNTIDQRNFFDWKNFIVGLFMIVELLKL